MAENNGLVLVTGGTGYVAGHIVAELLNRGYHVRTTVRTAAKEQVVRDAVATATDPADRLHFAHADLTRDEGWDTAMEGVTYVMHVASPLGLSGSDPQALIDTAHGGTLRVLDAAARAGVRRVVMTSAANTSSPSSYADDGITDETLWTDPDDPNVIPYRRSKTVAELAAWGFAEAHPGGPEITTVLPGAVFGPTLSTSTTGSVGIIAALLTGKMVGIPRIGLEVVDVRDLADVHIRAMTSPKAADERFLATGEFMWMADIAQALRQDLGTSAANVTTHELDDDVVRKAAETDVAMAEILPGLGRRSRHSTDKARRLLNWRPRPGREAVTDCARSLIAHGAVPADPTSI
ncbi:NAD-dependent epimerase/dehydratase family protein [Streptomyces rubiginosohelvolus]|uniref:NAD-dependent epimerase/dehydratase family protein n=1 Tax=Streptomyces rubiginosohelvolus TaxID=67362 RepID=UPI0036584282